jgi:hypothetical protein
MIHGFIKAASIIGAVLAIFPDAVLAEEFAKKGTTSYTTRYVFNPMGYEITPGVGKVVPMLLVGTTTNTKGEAAFDKMKARCFAIKVEAGEKSYFDGSCTMTDDDGDKVFSTFDSRILDKTQPDMDCGTHSIIGGTGKYKGITGSEAFDCIFKKENKEMEPFAAYIVDTPHNVAWEIK